MATRSAREFDSEPVVLADVLPFMQLLWAVVHRLERTSSRLTGES